MAVSGGDKPRFLLLDVAGRLLAISVVLIGLGITAEDRLLQTTVDAGEAAFESGDYPAAVDAYRRAGIYQPWVVDHLARTVRAEVLAGTYREAAYDLARLSGLRPLSLEEQSWWSLIYGGLGKTDQAITSLEESWQNGTIDSDGLRLLANVYRERGSSADERSALESLQAAQAASVGELSRLVMLQSLDSPEQAVMTLGQIASQGSDQPVWVNDLFPVLDARMTDPPEYGYFRLGFFFVSIGQWELAETALEKALAYNPGYGEACAVLALVRARLRKPALGAAQQGVALAPDSSLAHFMLGRIWKEQGDPQSARRSFEQAAALDPQNPALSVEIASTYRLEGRLPEAEHWMETAVEQSNDAYEFRLLLAQFYIDEEYLLDEKGIVLAQALVDENPGSAGAHAALGWGHFLLGEFDTAFSEMDTALDLNPDLPRANAHKAVLLESQNRMDEAVAYYSRAVELDPDGYFGAFSRRALERIVP
ncbi:MAG: tetratricopeptide repeat protein [Anaerolineae bacterium]|nr:tetratricopeptide repeat protein [Anaerolineae bacterium]